MPDGQASSAAEYVEHIADLLFTLLLDVIHAHQPEIAPVLRGEQSEGGLSPELAARTIQAQGIWFQLLSIAEQNIANSFEFAQKLVRAKDIQEVMALQQEYLQRAA